MWIRTINGYRFFKVEHTQQGIPYPTKDITGKSNLYADKEN